MNLRYCDLASDGFNLVVLSYGAGSCSAAISAACHSPKDDCIDTLALGELMWGETGLPLDWDTDQNGDDGKGHCSFTLLDAVQPSSTKSYA